MSPEKQCKPSNVMSSPGRCCCHWVCEPFPRPYILRTGVCCVHPGFACTADWCRYRRHVVVCFLLGCARDMRRASPDVCFISVGVDRAHRKPSWCRGSLHIHSQWPYWDVACGLEAQPPHRHLSQDRRGRTRAAHTIQTRTHQTRLQADMMRLLQRLSSSKAH